MLIAFAVLASNVTWHWTPNGYVAGLIAAALAYGLTYGLGSLLAYCRRGDRQSL